MGWMDFDSSQGTKVLQKFPLAGQWEFNKRLETKNKSKLTGSGGGVFYRKYAVIFSILCFYSFFLLCITLPASSTLNGMASQRDRLITRSTPPIWISFFVLQYIAVLLKVQWKMIDI